MTRVRRVALLIESSGGFGRELIEGIARYSREHGPWSMYFEPHDLDMLPPRWLIRWKGDGIIVRLNDSRMLRAVRATGLPAVDVRGRFPGRDPLPVVGCNNRRMVQLVARHLLDQGFRRFAFFGVPLKTNRILALRRTVFEQLVRNVGSRCDTFELSGNEQQSSANWDRELDRIAEWLRQLSKPVGIMACDDHRGYQLLDACRQAGVRVPDEVAVIGINNDRVLCELAYPPLSSVDPGGVRIGYEAGACLDRMMQGKRPPRKPISLEPSGLVVRQSSDLIAVEDQEVVTALMYIRENAGTPIDVEHVVRAVTISRSVLERRFQQYLGRTPKAEITRVRMAHAKQLLAQSDLPLSEIAHRCGFSHENNFSEAFLRESGLRPGAYRNRWRFGREGSHD